MSLRLAAVGMALGFLMLTATLLVIVRAPEEGPFKSHSPIIIDGDSQFTEANGVIGGKGSCADPYIIEGWLIRSDATDGITVRNTTSSFVIRSVLISGYPDAGNYGVFLRNVSNCLIRDSNISGTVAAVLVNDYESLMCNNITIEGLAITSSKYGVVSHNSHNVSVHDNMISSVEIVGIYTDYCTKINLTRNQIYANQQATVIDRCTNVTITGNKIGWSGVNGVMVQNSDVISISNNFLDYVNTGIRVSGSRMFEICNNNVTGSADYYQSRLGIAVATSQDCNIRDNHILNMNGPGVSLATVDNATITRNSITRGFTGMYFGDLNNSVIEGNSVLWNSRISLDYYDGGTGIMMDSCEHDEIVNNSVWGITNGISLEDSENMTIENNIVTDDWDGIKVRGGSHLIVKDNRIQSENCALDLDGQYQVDPLISDSTISDNHLTGEWASLYLTSSVVMNNTFVLDSMSMRIANSTVQHNNFNTSSWGNLPIGDNGVLWDCGYPQGGNYWLNFTGLDEFQGVDQDLPGSDGVGDTPQNISENNSDRYPMVNPIVFADSTPPVTELNLSGVAGRNGWYITNVDVEIVGHDVWSDINSTMYRIDEQPWSTYDGRFRISNSGIHSLDYYSMDNRNNSEKIRHTTIKADMDLPVLSVTSPRSGSTVTSNIVVVTLNFTDNASGIGRSGGYWGVYERDLVSVDRELILLDVQDGSIGLGLFAVDDAGNKVEMNFEIRKDTDIYSSKGPFGQWLNVAIYIDVFLALASIVLYGLHRRSLDYEENYHLASLADGKTDGSSDENKPGQP